MFSSYRKLRRNIKHMQIMWKQSHCGLCYCAASSKSIQQIVPDILVRLKMVFPSYSKIECFSMSHNTTFIHILGYPHVWGLTCTGTDTRAMREERVLAWVLMPCAADKKASLQNYKPEKISVLQHWEQNGFCFLQDNELTRAHHTVNCNQCRLKC